MSPELLTVGAVVDPFARGCDPLGRRNGCGVANHSHDVTMAACFGAQNAKAVLAIMVRDALDETGNNFLRLILRWMFHTLNSRDAGPDVAACSATGTLLRISAVSTRSAARGHALVFLCGPLAHLP